MNRTLRGAVIGAAAGLGVGILGELLVYVVRLIYPTDVAIVGFALIWAVPLGLLVGAVSGWRGWIMNPYRLVIVAAVPGLLASMLAAFAQWSMR
ncbi:MAG: hypothetical protein WD274_04745 [Acidimicrobiia bacterium]